MDSRYAISLVLSANLPFIKKFNAPPRRIALPDDLAAESGAEAENEKAEEILPVSSGLLPETIEESWFFETLSETYLPLLDMFARLEEDQVPFRLGLSISPIFVQMLYDEKLVKKFNEYLNHQIDFGMEEITRVKNDPGMYRLAKAYVDKMTDRQAVFTGRYNGSIIKAFEHHRRKGRIEFLATAATNAFLPFLCHFPEAVAAQIEVALSSYRHSLAIASQGFWLPDMGWTKELDSFLRAYGFSYTIVDSQGMVFGDPPPARGTFFPVKTPEGLVILGRDFNAMADIAALQKDGLYRDNSGDIGYELPVEALEMFLSKNGARVSTGFKYWKMAGNNRELYDSAAAQSLVQQHARAFLENSRKRLAAAAAHIKEQPLSLCACNADSFGRHWHEGPWFLEALFRSAEEFDELQFMTPSEYLSQKPKSSFETSCPEFSSWGENGYAEVWLDSSNDWIYRHLNRAIERMVELAERYSESSSLKERALNQAAREIMLAQTSDWPAFLYRQESTEYARLQLETSLQNFTTIYESLGSSHINTEWLTSLERQHNIFPNINYRVFRKKR